MDFKTFVMTRYGMSAPDADRYDVLRHQHLDEDSEEADDIAFAQRLDDYFEMHCTKEVK